MAVGHASAEDQLKVAIGQINNWENQAPTLGQDAGIFKKHGLVLENVGTRGAGETMQAVISGSRRYRRRRRRRRRDARLREGRAGAHPAAGVYRHRRSLLVREGGFADQKPEGRDRRSNTIAYSTNGSSSNNIVVAFVAGARRQGQADRDRRVRPATLTAGDVRSDRYRLGGAAVRPQGDQRRQDPHRRARQRRAVAARADRARA